MDEELAIGIRNALIAIAASLTRIEKHLDEIANEISNIPISIDAK